MVSSRNCLRVVISVGIGNIQTLCTLVRSDLMPSRQMMCPRYATSSCSKVHFWGLRQRPAFLSQWNTSKWDRCSSNVREATRISSTWAKQHFHSNPAKITCIKHWNVAGALHSPNGIQVSSNKPWWVAKAVLGCEDSSISICQ